MEVLKGLHNFISKQSKEKTKNPELAFDDRSLEVIRKIYEVDNPSLHEIPFLGVVDENEQVEEIIYEPDFPRQSRLRQTGNAVFTSTVDKNELVYLFRQAQSVGKLDSVRMVGHLHPSGKTQLGQLKVIVPPSEDALIPSKSDISFMGALGESNPDFNFDYTAITANTPDGHKLRVYNTRQLLKTKKVKNLDKLPNQTIDL